MRRLLISLFAVAAFLGCSKDDYPNDVIRTLASAESWQELKTYAYTEPNGGEIVFCLLIAGLCWVKDLKLFPLKMVSLSDIFMLITCLFHITKSM